jgi:hypothetical protein
MVAMTLIMGVASPLWIRMIDPSVHQSLQSVTAQSVIVKKPAWTITHLLAMRRAAK